MNPLSNWLISHVNIYHVMAGLSVLVLTILITLIMGFRYFGARPHDPK